ncbi:NAD-dependent epimerase/dehydratase family protein [Psychrobacillus vulpis]|uniref:NAD-dependent epimerase/dehydratase family protein n=1 Tax=Psychrobacillus vulpis TaxID=2325572 RepID=A0A544TW36_9BACI|nr:NAD-dependent epimerase/dehydratase family protein [Psychrobacillus vulpis]TQR21665.1 NAD-dependent epimerase/dehydratase family protein [Psychrobacillus vulpis]
MKSKPRLLITGANGFTGIHACHYFKKAGYEVIAVTRSPMSRIFDERIRLEQCDLSDKYQVKNLIQKTRPDRLLHLAGQNHVQESWTDPITSLEANAMSTALLIEAIRQEDIDCKIIIIGSALQFDLSKFSSLQHPYSLSKTIQVLIAQSWELLYGMDIVIVKSSNLIGPGVSNGVCSILAKKVAAMELHDTERVLTVNNLFAQRDFVDVRDAIRAYDKLFNVGKAGTIYDISSGKPRYLKEITDTLQALSFVDIEIQSLENKKEKIDVIKPSLLLDVGWSPLIPFEKSIEEVLNYQRKNLL